MFLEIHDAEAGNSHMGTVRSLDYDYQAEIWVTDTAAQRRTAARWVLFLDDGTPCRAWERKGEEIEEVPVDLEQKPQSRSMEYIREKAN